MEIRQLLEELGIDLKGKTSGQIKTQCKWCGDTRTHKRDPSLSVDIDEGVYNCHHCGKAGKVHQKKAKREYVRPAPRLEKLGEKSLTWFEQERKISNNTLLRFGITEGKEWMPQFEQETGVICFNYLRDDCLVNIKFRGPKKSFKMAKDAELIFYNLDAIKEEKEIIIVEGEIDCLSMHEAGIFNSVSVPNGASKGNQKLEYLDNCWEDFESATRIILAVDDDEAGRALREELARRNGKDKCWTVEYPEGCKDANEVLVKYGREALKTMIEAAAPWPLEGIETMDTMYPTIKDLYEGGLPTGHETGISGFDNLLRFEVGQLTIATGVPGSGKSEFVDWIMCQLTKNFDWSWGVCSFENQPPAMHATKIMEKITGKAFGFRLNPEDRMDIYECEHAIGMVDSFFHLFNLTEIDVTLNGILAKGAELVRRKGIKGLVIDPWNYIEHQMPAGYTETQYVSEALTSIRAFAVKYGVHVILIAHPTKIKKEGGKYEVPNLYSISGSAHFFNKTDNGITVYRDFQTNQVDVYVQKVRFHWLGKTGFCSFQYDTMRRQYIPMIGT